MLVICSDAKVKEKIGVGVDVKVIVNQWTRDKVQIGFVPRSRGHLFQFAARGSMTACQCQLALAGSGNLVALAFSAPNSGRTGLLVTSLPPNQLVLSGSAFNLKAEQCPFSVEGESSWLHGYRCHMSSLPGRGLVH